MSAAELTCPCGFTVRIEAGPDGYALASDKAREVMFEHFDYCRAARAASLRRPNDGPPIRLPLKPTPETHPELYGEQIVDYGCCRHSAEDATACACGCKHGAPVHHVQPPEIRPKRRRVTDSPQA